jgi:hypothetical protein
MQSPSMLLIAFAATYAYAVVAGAALGRPLGQRYATWIATPLLLAPLLLPTCHVGGRAAVSFVAVDLALKVVDYGRELRLGWPGRWREFLGLLPPMPLLLVRFKDRPPLHGLTIGLDLARVLFGGAVVLGVFALLQPLSYLQAIRENFWLDHVVKVTLFIVLIEVGSYAMQGAERLLGYDTARPMRNFYLSLTPAEFWARYNTRVHSWLEANVYRPCGGRIRGILAVFFVSAVLHELMFDITTSHPDGYQFTFFMLQAPAVIASPWLKRHADRLGIIGHATVRVLTIVWFYATSIFFFRGVERIFPIVYASQPWLP